MAETLFCAFNATSQARQSPFLYRALYDLDGRKFTWNVFPDLIEVWPWIESEIAERFDCGEEDVGLIEDDNGCEIVTVAGNPVAYLYSRAAR